MTGNWSLTIAEVIQRPVFAHAEVVAGKRGLTHPIRWVHILEAAANAHFLNGGELILSTGVGFGEDTDKRLDYLHELINRKAVGLCIELGSYVPHIPSDMLELAEQNQFPLIVFHQPVRFVDITLDLHELIVSRQTEALRKLEAYSRGLQQLTLQAQGIPKLLNHLQAHVHETVFFMPVEEAPIYAPERSKALQEQLTGQLAAALSSGKFSEKEHGLFDFAENEQVMYQPIQLMGHVLGYLGIVLYKREPEEFLHLTLDYTATAMAQILMRKMFSEERSLDSQNRLFDDLLADRYKQEEQIRGLLGIRPTKKIATYYAAMMEVSWGKMRYDAVAESPFHDLTGVIRSVLLRKGFRSLLRIKGHRLYLLLIEKQPLEAPREMVADAFKELEGICSQALGRDDVLLYGISRPSDRYADVYRHFQEAEQVLSIRTDLGSPFFDDLGVYRLLMHVQSSQALQSFITDYLGPLIRHDQEYNSQLLQTLRVLLDHNASKQETAEALFIHRQTLYHRLDKIRSLIGDNFLEPHQRICLEVALRAYEWVEKKR
ncbi:PucR family transcriptional regulator [Brevibacillus fluminis]|uniref:PucR family transcriptional regulator n=1 Tax=Brevibacillus fluminis TaxID=511487 RepID=UPI003F8C5C06